MDKIYETLEQLKEKHVKRLAEVLKQPTIFNDHPNIRKCAEMYASYLREAGFQQVDLIETDLNPLVYAEYNCCAPKTILVYNYFDILPNDNEDYVFNSKEKNIESFGSCLTGRGLSLIHI